MNNDTHSLKKYTICTQQLSICSKLILYHCTIRYLKQFLKNEALSAFIKIGSAQIWHIKSSLLIRRGFSRPLKTVAQCCMSYRWRLSAVIRAPSGSVWRLQTESLLFKLEEWSLKDVSVYQAKEKKQFSWIMGNVGWSVFSEKMNQICHLAGFCVSQSNACSN